MSRFTPILSVLLIVFLGYFLCVSAGSVGANGRSSSGGCDQGIEIRNGFATFIENENVALFECLSGYVPYGNMKATCVQGAWEPEPAKCVKKGCDQLKIPIHGKSEEEIAGAVVKFKCDSGYSIEGDSVLYCDGKIWSGVSPICTALPKKTLDNGGLEKNKTDL